MWFLKTWERLALVDIFPYLNKLKSGKVEKSKSGKVVFCLTGHQVFQGLLENPLPGGDHGGDHVGRGRFDLLQLVTENSPQVYGDQSGRFPGHISSVQTWGFLSCGLLWVLRAVCVRISEHFQNKTISLYPVSCAKTEPEIWNVYKHLCTPLAVQKLNQKYPVSWAKTEPEISNVYKKFLYPVSCGKTEPEIWNVYKNYFVIMKGETMITFSIANNNFPRKRGQNSIRQLFWSTLDKAKVPY